MVSSRGQCGFYGVGGALDAMGSNPENRNRWEHFFQGVVFRRIHAKGNAAEQNGKRGPVCFHILFLRYFRKGASCCSSVTEPRADVPPAAADARFCKSGAY